MSYVLVIDDVPAIAQLFQTIFNQLGLEVLYARNGEEGFALLQQVDFAPNLIICNFKMPRMDGLTFLQMMRQHPQWETIPFILNTAQLYPSVAQTALDYRANGLLSKPFKLAELNSLLSSLGII